MVRWRIRSRRIALGLRQEDVAAKLGQSQKHFQMYEAGYVNFNPRLETLLGLAEVLELEPAALLAKPTKEEVSASKKDNKTRVFKS